MIGFFKNLLADLFGNSAPSGWMSKEREHRKRQAAGHRANSHKSASQQWRAPGFNSVLANTRSEARAKFKLQRRLLPKGLEITRV